MEHNQNSYQIVLLTVVLWRHFIIMPLEFLICSFYCSWEKIVLQTRFHYLVHSVHSRQLKHIRHALASLVRMLNVIQLNQMEQFYQHQRVANKSIVNFLPGHCKSNDIRSYLQWIVDMSIVFLWTLWLVTKKKVYPMETSNSYHYKKLVNMFFLFWSNLFGQDKEAIVIIGIAKVNHP